MLVVPGTTSLILRYCLLTSPIFCLRMLSSFPLKKIDHCRVSPPHGSVPSIALPLTFLDIPWLLFSTSEPLFFYEFHHSTTYFTQTILSILKHSLSLTLQSFFLLAGSLITPPEPSKPYFMYNDGDSVSLTVVESNGDFSSLSGHHPRNAREFHDFVPSLKPENRNNPGTEHPLLSVQITIFPNCGFCIGFALREVAADGRTFDNFLKTWASICRYQQQKCENFPTLKFISRDVISDPRELEPIFLEQWWKCRNLQEEVKYTNGTNFDEMVRATFVVSPPEMEKIKVWILTRSMEIFGSTHLYLSPYVLTCAFLWVCWTKIYLSPHVEDFLQDVPHFFGFIAGGINRLKCSVSSSYIGNCVAFGRSMVRRNELMGEDGIVYAAKAIGDTILELNNESMGKPENWILDWNEIIGSELHVVITGSPKVRLYGLDFGWGIPKKVEEISIDKTRALSLCESRDIVGGIEIGLTLPKAKMAAFSELFYKGVGCEFLE